MRKMTTFQLGLFLFSARMMSLNVQVRIGADADPHAGAVLDLGGNPSQATGMTVYNNKFALDGAGVYVWDGKNISSVVFAPYNLGANIAKLDCIASYRQDCQNQSDHKMLVY
jgi:hypothetical protein